MRRILLLVIVAWGLLAPLTYHPDTKLTLRYAALESGKVWDIYGYLYQHKLDIPDFHYPPAHFWWLKIHYPISRFIGGAGFDQWLVSGSVQASFSPDSWRYNLAAKFPLLVLGILTGVFVFLIVKRWSKSGVKASWGALFWFFNPVTLYSLVMMGQNDIVAISLFLAGLYVIDQWWLVVLLWGVAAGVKSYPLVWAVMFLLVWEKKVIRLLLKLAGVLVVYGLILSPWLGRSYFMESVMNSGLSQRMFIANIPIGFDKTILVVPLLLVLLGLKAWSIKGGGKMAKATKVVFQSALLILGFSHFNPQWMMWLIPFLSIWVAIGGVKPREGLIWLAMLTAWMGLTIGFEDRFLTWGIVSPISPNLPNYPAIAEFVKNRGASLAGVINLCQTVLAGIGLWYLLGKDRVKNLDISGVTKMSKWWVLVPWMVTSLLVVVVLSLKVESVSRSGEVKKEVTLSEIANKTYRYSPDKRLKYLEISLNNPGLNSKDRGVLVVRDGYGNTIEKEFSGFNAGLDSWVRVDLPASISIDEGIDLTVKETAVNDGWLKIKMDDQDRWAVNFYSRQSQSVSEFLGRLAKLWWWWLILGILSWSYWRSEARR